MRKLGLLSWAFIVLMSAALLLQLGCRPIVGINDNGDFWRITESFGLSYPSGYRGDLVTWNRYYRWDGHLLRIKMFPTSELLPAGLAVSLSAILHKGRMFDVVTLGLVHAVIYIAGLALVVLATAEWQIAHRVIACLALLMMFSDVGYVSYFNSLYTEPSALVYLVAALGALCVLLLRDLSMQTARRLLVVYFVALGLFSTAKPQNIPVGVILAGLGYCTSARLSLVFENAGIRRLGLRWTTASVLLCIGFALVANLVPGTRNCNTYNMVFNEILRHSKSPKADLKELGLGPSYMKYRSTFAWAPGVTEDIRRDVHARVGDRRIFVFYLRHPSRLFELAGRGARSVFVMRAPHLGNFERGRVSLRGVDSSDLDYNIRENVNLGSDHPYVLPAQYRSQAFDLWSGFKERVLPRRGWFLALCMAVNVGAIVVKRRWFDFTWRRSAVTTSHISLLLCAFTQFFLVLLGEGERDIVKHFFLFNLLCDACLAFLVIYVAYLLSNLRQSTLKRVGGR